MPSSGSIISKEDQETACREYCLARGLTVTTVFRDEAGARDEFAKMITAATRDDSAFDYIVVWKRDRFTRSSEETIELRDKLRRVCTKLVSATEKGIDD